jgi:uncharacterized repeat protein (TIGR03803 family)
MLFASTRKVLLNEMRMSHICERVFRRGLIKAAGSVRVRSLLLVLTGLSWMLGGRVTAQTFTTLHNFAASDGPQPSVGMISGNTLYGTAGQGGTSSNGAIFRVNIDGSGFTNLHRFSPRSAPYYTNDGTFPNISILSDRTLYGAAHEDGPTRRGTLFSIKIDGTGFTNLYNFDDPSNGVFPSGALVMSGNTLYGSAYSGGIPSGGTGGNGTIFKIGIDGKGYTNLHYFEASYLNPIVQEMTNNEGAYPGLLVLSGDTLYGTATEGGSSGQGTLFKVNTDGSDFTTLHSFTPIDLTKRTNDDGAVPADLILSDGILYGTAVSGGSSGGGTVFKLNTDGTGFTTLYSFSAYGPFGDTNNDGAAPGGLILMGHRLYGTAGAGGSLGRGTLFSINTDGSDFVVLHTFAGKDGIFPGAMTLSGNTFYGAASQGGTASKGTVFSLSFAPQLTITRSSDDVILSWPTAVAGFDYADCALQSTTNAGSSSVWTTHFPAPVVVNGRYTVTNPVSDARQFFRLRE